MAAILHAALQYRLMVVAVDVGTSSARAALYDDTGRPVEGRFHQTRYEPLTTPDGGVEHDARALTAAVATCLDAVAASPRARAIRGVGVATFWHGLLGFDAAGAPVTPVFMWGDARSAAEAGVLRAALDEAAVHARTGCHLHASYWPAKLRWLARDRPEVVRRVARWGSLGEHLELELFGEAATTVSMASGTGLFDQARADWDPETMAAAGLDADHLFPLTDLGAPRQGLRRPWAARWPALREAPWFPAVGDGAASNVGSDCIGADRIALNVGTSAALRVVTGALVTPPRGLWRYALDARRAMVGGATSEGGNVYAWCRDVLRLPADDDALEAALARRSPDGHGLTVLPFLAGERAPGWRGHRRAVLAGLSLDTGPLDIVRAALEAVALRLALVYDLLAPHAAHDHGIVASGGAARSRAWSRILADALGRPVTLSREPEATSRGAALLALEALGVLPDLAVARAPLGDTVEPDPAAHARYRGALERQQRLDQRV
jgi:gluconokinase